MSKGPTRFEHRSLQDAQSIVRYLEALCAGFDQGRLTFRSGADKLEVAPRGLLDLRIAARQDDDEVKIALRVKWRVGSKKDYSPHPLVIETEAQGD